MHCPNESDQSVFSVWCLVRDERNAMRERTLVAGVEVDKQSAVPRNLMYRLLSKDLRYRQPTMVVAGPHRRNTWLYVHATTPTVLRLHPPVVAFLRDALDELTATGVGPGPKKVLMWSLPADTHASYPDCVVLRDGAGAAWLHVHAASPSTVRLHPVVIEFLRDALADLPAHPTRHGQPARAVGSLRVASIPNTELIVWQDKDLRGSLWRGLADAVEGRTVPLDELFDE
jgi:hypothetical protein